jgi:hypothetical protein
VPRLVSQAVRNRKAAVSSFLPKIYYSDAAFGGA